MQTTGIIYSIYQITHSYACSFFVRYKFARVIFLAMAALFKINGFERTNLVFTPNFFGKPRPHDFSLV